MILLLKTIVGVLIAGILYLIARFTDEYFRPYKRKD